MIGTHNERAVEAARAPAGSYALSIVAAGVVIAILYWARIVFVTAMLAVIVALILEPFVSLLVKARFPRGMASFVVCLVAVLVLYFAGLSAYNQISSIASDVPAFKEHLSALIEDVSGRIRNVEDLHGAVSDAHAQTGRTRAAQPCASRQQAKQEGRARTGSRSTTRLYSRSAHP